MASQGLTPNHLKTQVLSITRSSVALPLKISIYGHVITPRPSVKYLGVVISSNLSWSSHIKMTAKKAKQQLSFINRRFWHSPPAIRAQLCHTAVLPRIEYCGALWDPHCQSDVQALEMLPGLPLPGGTRTIRHYWPRCSGSPSQPADVSRNWSYASKF